MANIIDYIQLSERAEKVVELFTTSDAFLKNYLEFDELEQKSYLSHLVVNNVSYAFKSKPLLYEQIAQYLADKMEVSKNQIKLVGSAKTGFSVSPQPTYGRKFNENSDLDFAIIDETLFSRAITDYKLWKKNFTDGKYPKELHNKYWIDNLENLKHQNNRGFIDTYKIPNYIEFSTTQTLNNSLSLIVNNLERHHNIKVKNASARIYKDWKTFTKQLRLNTESVLEKVN